MSDELSGHSPFLKSKVKMTKTGHRVSERAGASEPQSRSGQASNSQTAAYEGLDTLTHAHARSTHSDAHTQTTGSLR